MKCMRVSAMNHDAKCHDPAMLFECLSTEVLIHMLQCANDESYMFMWRTTTAFLMCSKHTMHAVYAWRLTVRKLDFLPTWEPTNVPSTYMQRFHLIKTIIWSFPNVDGFYLHKACYITDNVLAKNVLFSNANVKILDLGCYYHKLSANGIASLCDYFPNLRCLKLNAEMLDDVHIIVLALKMKNLVTLQLAKCSNVTDCGVQFIAKAFPLLRVLKLQNSKMTNKGMFTLSFHCKQLQYIDLAHSIGIKNNTVMCIALTYPKLKSLNINGCKNVGGDAIATLSSCVELETLLMNNCTYVTDVNMLAVLSGCPQLRVLDVSSCSKLTSTFVEALSSKCHNLENVSLRSLTRLTDHSVTQLLQQCKKLKYIDVEGCSNLSENVHALVTLHNVKHKIAMHQNM